MKSRILKIFAVVAVTLLTLVGCSAKIDTAKVRASLQPTLDAGQKEQLEIAMTAVDAGKPKDALQPLRKLAFGAKLDKDQLQLLRDTMGKVQRQIAKSQ